LKLDVTLVFQCAEYALVPVAIGVDILQLGRELVVLPARCPFYLGNDHDAASEGVRAEAEAGIELVVKPVGIDIGAEGASP
jgi:hypothetical protein